jgi:hypothetical protein
MNYHSLEASFESFKNSRVEFELPELNGVTTAPKRFGYIDQI